MSTDAQKLKQRKTAMPLYSPPPKFAMVEKGIYRSAYPGVENLPYLLHKKIRTIVPLSIEFFTGNVTRAIKTINEEEAQRAAAEAAAGGGGGSLRNVPGSSRSTGLQVVEVASMRSWQNDGLLNDGEDFSQLVLQRALDFAVDTHWHPVLFVCPTGELQTSVLVGCLRRYQYWSLSSIFCEAESFCSIRRSLPKSIMAFVELWDPEVYTVNESDVLDRKRRWVSQLRAEYARLVPVAVGRRDRGAAKGSARRGRHDGVDSASSRSDSPSGSGADETSASSSPRGRRRGRGGNAAFRRPGSSGSDTRHRRHRRRSLSPSSASSSSSLAAEDAANHALSPAGVTEEAALLRTSGAQPPTARRRAIKHALAASQTISLAEWYTRGLALREKQYSLRDDRGDADVAPSPPRVTAFPISSAEAEADSLPPPHLRYAGVRNPPALDERSTFTKESIVEEDDD